MLTTVLSRWVASDMGSLIGSPPKSLEEGARIPARLALDHDIGNVSGKYWSNDSLTGTGYGKPREVSEWYGVGAR